MLRWLKKNVSCFAVNYSYSKFFFNLFHINALQLSDNEIVIKFILLGINMFWALFRAPFNPFQEAQAKMSLTQAQNLFMPANMNKNH